MTEQIQVSIALLRKKFLGIHQEFQGAKEEITELNEQLAVLKADLIDIKNSKMLLEVELKTAKSIIEETNKQVVNDLLSSNGRSNEQIDDLVKEIENCIAAIKK
jgi:predicted  nucleic acid-binding Zn-ribbon protein